MYFLAPPFTSMTTGHSVVSDVLLISILLHSIVTPYELSTPLVGQKLLTYYTI